MNKNVLIGILVIALIVGAILVMDWGNMAGNNEVATSTTSGTNPNPSPSPTPPVAGAPTVTTDINTAASNSTAVVTGKVTPNGSQTSYWYEYGQTSALGTRTIPQKIGSGFINIPAPAYIIGLAPNTFYYFRLSAQNGYGTVNGAMYTFTTNNNPPPQGNAPTTHTDAATNVSRATANLNGRVNPNNSDTSYWFEYGETTDLGTATAFQSAGSGNNSVNASVSLSGLTPLTKYYFRLNAQNQFGTVNGAIVSFTTQGPKASGAPSANTNSASAITTSTATLRGKVNPNGDTTTVWFEYSEDSLLGSILGAGTQRQMIGSGTATLDVSADITGLVPNTKYFYRVVASNSYGTVRGNITNFRTNQ